MTTESARERHEGCGCVAGLQGTMRLGNHDGSRNIQRQFQVLRPKKAQTRTSLPVNPQRFVFPATAVPGSLPRLCSATFTRASWSTPACGRREDGDESMRVNEGDVRGCREVKGDHACA